MNKHRAVVSRLQAAMTPRLSLARIPHRATSPRRLRDETLFPHPAHRTPLKQQEQEQEQEQPSVSSTIAPTHLSSPSPQPSARVSQIPSSLPPPPGASSHSRSLQARHGLARASTRSVGIGGTHKLQVHKKYGALSASQHNIYKKANCKRRRHCWM